MYSSILSAPIAAAWALGFFHDERGTNWLDSGAHYYDVYECADGEYVSVGAIEAKFYANLLAGLGLSDADLPSQDDESQWPAMKERFASIFRTKPRDEWLEVFAGADECVAPVLRYGEVLSHPHISARDTYVEVGGVPQPAPAPRFSRTPASLARPPAAAGAHTDEVLRDAGLDAAEIDVLRSGGAVA